MEAPRYLASLRRDQILAAAMACFLENGFKKTGLKKIAQQCNMSVGHIYYYFRNKDEVIEHIITIATTDFLNHLTKTCIGRTISDEALRANSYKTVDMFIDEDKGRFVMMMVNESFDKPNLRRILQEAGSRIREHMVKLYHPDEKDPKTLRLLNARMAVLISMLEGLRLSNFWYPESDVAYIRDAAVDCIFTLVKSWMMD